MGWVKNKIRQAVINLLTDDSEAFPLVQVSNNGKTYNAVRLNPYGISSQPPSDGMGLVLVPEYGGEQTKYIFCDDPKRRFKGLKEFEVVVGNYKTRARIKFLENGDVDLDIPSGNLIANVSGSVTITAGKDSSMTCPNFTFNSHVLINGNLAWSGNGSGVGGAPAEITGGINNTGGDIVSNGISLEQHLTTDVVSGGDLSGPPQ